MYPALQKAVSTNKDAIMLLLNASGPQDLNAIKRECATQAYADDDSISLALRELEVEGRAFSENSDGEKGGTSIWDAEPL